LFWSTLSIRPHNVVYTDQHEATNMIKSELISILVDKLKDVPERKISNSVNNIIETMSNALSQGERIEIRGFGSFSLHFRPPRNAHNPKTGDKVITQAKYSPHFKPGKSLKERVNASKEDTLIHNIEDAYSGED
jgi:integration host factor subunit beta